MSNSAFYGRSQVWERCLTRAKAGWVAMAAGTAALTAATFFATLFSALQETRAAREHTHSSHSLYCAGEVETLPTLLAQVVFLL